MIKLNQNSDTYLEWDRLYYLTESGKTALPSTATVQITLFDSEGTTVTGQTFPTALTYHSAKANGTYYGVIESSANTVLHNRYVLQLDISGSGLPDAQYRYDAIAVVPNNNPSCFSC